MCCETNARKIHEMLRLRLQNLVQFPCYDAQLEYQMSPGLIAQIPLIPGKRERVSVNIWFPFEHMGFFNPW